MTSRKYRAVLLTIESRLENDLNTFQKSTVLLESHLVTSAGSRALFTLFYHSSSTLLLVMAYASSDSAADNNMDSDTSLSDIQDMSAKHLSQTLSHVMPELYEDNVAAKILNAAISGLENNVCFITESY